MADNTNNPFAGVNETLEMNSENEAMFEEMDGDQQEGAGVETPKINNMMTITGPHSHFFTVDPETHTVSLANEEVVDALSKLQGAIDDGAVPGQIEIDAHVFSPVTGKLEKVSDFMPSGSPHKELIREYEASSEKLATIPQAITAESMDMLILPTPLNRPAPILNNADELEDFEKNIAAANEEDGADLEDEEEQNTESKADEPQRKNTLPEPNSAVEAAVFGAITLAHGLIGAAGHAIKSTLVEGWNLASNLGSKLWHNISEMKDTQHRSAAENTEVMEHRFNEAEPDIDYAVEASNDAKADFNDFDTGINHNLAVSGIEIDQPFAGGHHEMGVASIEPKMTAGITAPVKDEVNAVPPELLMAGETSMATNHFMHSHDVGERINAWSTKSLEANDSAKADIAGMAGKIDEQMAQASENVGRFEPGTGERIDALRSEKDKLRDLTKQTGEQCREWIADPDSNYNQVDADQKEELVEGMEAMFDADNKASPLNGYSELIDEMEDDEGGFKAALKNAFQGLKDLFARLKEALGITTGQRVDAEEMGQETRHTSSGPSL